MRVSKEEKIVMANKICDELIKKRDEACEHFVSLEDIFKLLNLDSKLSNHEKLARYVIKKARDCMSNMGFVVYNKKNVGWKVAVGVEKVIERLKAQSRFKKLHSSASKDVELLPHELTIVYGDKEAKDALDYAKNNRMAILKAGAIIGADKNSKLDKLIGDEISDPNDN